MSGGGGTQQVQSTTNTSNLPDYAQPYVMQAFAQAQAASALPYTPYTGQQIADFTPLQQTTQNNIANLQGPTQYGTATNVAQTAANNALNIGQTYTPAQFSAQQVQAPSLSQYQMQGPAQFNQQAVNQYMSPYMQDVMNVQSNEAVRNAQINNVSNNLAQAASGTYGGSNTALTTAQNNRNLQTQLANIQATGLQNAYANAQAQFNTQNQLQQQANAQNLNAALGVQSLGAGENLQAQLANQQQNLAAQQYGSQAQQFGANLGLQGLAQANQSAYALGNVGAQQQAATAQDIGLQTTAGAAQQAQNQNILNQQYLNFENQLNYPMQQLSYYSGILHGLPINPSSTSTQYMAAPSALAQVAGAGLGAASIANMLGTKSS